MSVLAPALFADKQCSDKRAWAAGFFIGLGLCSKVTFFPLILLTLLLGRLRAIAIAILASGVFTLFFLIPIFARLKSVFAWLFFLASHDGAHGSGTARFLDWAAIPERLGKIGTEEPLFVAAAIALMAVITFSRSRDKWKGIIIAASAGTLVLLVLKNFSIHYLSPALAIAPALVVWTISRFAQTSRPYAVAAAAAATMGIISTWSMSSSLAQERALRRENEKAVADAIARYDHPVVIGSYRAGYKPWAVLFGLAWVDWKFARLFPQMAAPDSLTYDSGLKKPWRAHSGPVDWSYLDQFDKAGRAVLLIQSRDNKVDQATAPTETILDQGYGDTVERIIVTPKTDRR
jgi:hypothetical protein